MALAIEKRDVDSIKFHFENGADPSLGLIAALSVRDARIFKLILERGADPECIIPTNARAALVAAIKSGDTKFVELLLQVCGAGDSFLKIDFVWDGMTPLMNAVLHNYERIAQRLICSGADPLFEKSW